jgi:polyisoprenoid-binding protein YceI
MTAPSIHHIQEFHMTTTAYAPFAPDTAGRQSWQIDPAHSSVEFAVRHLMISTVRGRFGQVSGAISLDETDASALNVHITIPVASIDTRQEQRDGHLRSPDFFDADRYPEIHFIGRQLTGDPRDTFQLLGDLTIRGVTREVTLDVTSEGKGPNPFGPGERAGYSATGKLDRRDFGLTYNTALETGGVAVGHEVKISIDLELVQSPEA